MQKNSFVLNETLKNDTFLVGELKLCKILLMNRKEIPWFILVPKRPDIKEIFELSDDESQLLMSEIKSFSNIVNDTFAPHKINIAALGNVVSQLHIHVIARYNTDSAWPAPVFGNLSETTYDENSKNDLINKIKSKLQ